MLKTLLALLRAIGTLLVAMTIVVVLVLLVAATPRGSAWLVGSGSSLAGGAFEAEGVEGTLLTGLRVAAIELQAGRTRILIEGAELQLSWPDVFRQRLRLLTARSGEVVIEIAPRPPDEAGVDGKPVKPLRLPFAIVADRLEVARLVLRLGGDPVEMGPFWLTGELVDGEIRIERFEGRLFGFEGSVTDGLFDTGRPFALRGDLSWQNAAAAISGSGTVSGDLEHLEVVQQLLVPTPVSVEGELRLLTDQPRLEAVARWQDLRRPIDGKDGEDGRGSLVLTSRSGQLRAAGWLDAFQADLQGLVQLGDAPEGRIAARVTGDREAILLQQLLLEALDGRITGTGRVTLADELRGQLEFAGTGLNPVFLDARFPGRIDGRGTVSFDAGGGLELRIPEASGTLLDRPFRASGNLRRAGQDFSAEAVRVAVGANRLELDGIFGRRLAGRFQVDAPDLATLWPGLRGQIEGSGEFGGTVARPEFELDVEGAGLAIGEFRVASLRATGGIGARDQIEVVLGAEALFVGKRSLGDLTAGVTGRLEAHSLEVLLSDGEVEVRLLADGGWQDGALRETLRSALVNFPGAQRWELQDELQLRIAATDNVSATAHCWAFGEARLCFRDSRLEASGFDAGLTLQGLPLAAFAPWLPGELSLSGTGEAELAVRSEAGRLTGSLRATLDAAGVSYQIPGEDTLETTFSEFRVALAVDDDALVYSFGVAERFGLNVVGAGQVIAPFGDEPVISGRVTGGMPELSSLAPLVERYVDVGDITGRMTIDATLTGNALRPDIIGGIALEEGSFAVPVAGIVVNDVSLAIAGQQDGTAAILGSARSGSGEAGSGKVRLEGSVLWRDRLLPTAEFSMTGSNFEVINLPQGRAQVSPDARVVFRDRQFRVSGDVRVPQGEVRLKRIGEAAVQPSPDTIVHGRSLTVVDIPPPLFVLDGLRIVLGDDVSFEGFGLTTALAGSLTLSQSLAADPTAVTGDGVITLKDGRFAAFGQRLEIERGSLVFAGTVTDPGLDVKAGRVINYEGRDVTVGVLLSGTLSRIQTRIYSDPAMGELDALSYLTTGKPLSAAGAGDRSMVSNTAIGLGLSQALPVVQKLGSALSVDEIGLDSAGPGGTAVVIGEQVGDDLYIRYTYGIFDKLGTVRATYRLNRRLSLEASSGEEQGLDLIYSINW